jgi:hypothetical protein
MKFFLCLCWCLCLCLVFTHLKESIWSMDSDVKNLLKTLQHTSALFKMNMETIENLQQWQTYLLQVQRLSFHSNPFKVQVCPAKLDKWGYYNCFDPRNCYNNNGVDIDTELIQDSSVVMCLAAFYNLKTLRQTAVKEITWENLFVQELHIIKSDNLHLNGIEKLPNLRTLKFENCKNVYLDYLFEVPNKIERIHAINTPSVAAYKERLYNIEFI